MHVCLYFFFSSNTKKKKKKKKKKKIIFFFIFFIFFFFFFFFFFFYFIFSFSLIFSSLPFIFSLLFLPLFFSLHHRSLHSLRLLLSQIHKHIRVGFLTDVRHVVSINTASCIHEYCKCATFIYLWSRVYL